MTNRQRETPPKQMFENDKQKLSFCKECGKLLFPVKVNYRLVMKCNCGFIEPFDEKSYKITSNIRHSQKEENIYRCICSKKFQSQNDFLEHIRNCTKSRKHNFNLLKKKGIFKDFLKFTILNYPETSINTNEKISKKMGLSISGKLKLVIDQSLKSQAISRLSYFKGYWPGNLLLTIISVIGPILQQFYAQGYDQERIFNNVRFFKNIKRVEEWTKYIFKMNSTQALLYFKGYRNFYDSMWWYQNFAIRKDFLGNTTYE